MKIREDLDGVVYVRTAEGVVVLEAGDDIPAGAEVGDHLVAKAAPARGRSKADAEHPASK